MGLFLSRKNKKKKALQPATGQAEDAHDTQGDLTIGFV